MSRQKLTVIGRGTAGLLAAMMARKWGQDDVVVEVVYNPEVEEASVGEGSQLSLPSLLYLCEGITQRDWSSMFNGTVKSGIDYVGWGNNDFFHCFTPPTFGMHFSAKDFQQTMSNLLLHKHGIQFVEKNVKSHDELDTDFIIDATGAPKDIDNNPEYERLPYIPVNSAMVAQIPWDFPHFQHTLAHAEYHGWIFGIPLQNRVSLGYMYNKDLSTKEEVEEDFIHYMNMQDYKVPDNFNHINFDSYKRKDNWPDNRTAYVGNSSLFLEPLEATAIQMHTNMIERTIMMWATNSYGETLEESRINCNKWYHKWIDEAETIITCHYAANGVEKWGEENKFWPYAQKLGLESIDNCERWLAWVRKTDGFEVGHMNPEEMQFDDNMFGGGWNLLSFNQNVKGLELYDNYS